MRCRCCSSLGDSWRLFMHNTTVLGEHDGHKVILNGTPSPWTPHWTCSRPSNLTMLSLMMTPPDADDGDDDEAKCPQAQAG